MSDNYTGVRVIDVGSNVVDDIYSVNKASLQSLDGRVSRHLSQNEYCVLKCNSQSVLTRVVGENLQRLRTDQVASGIKPRNKEQHMAMDALLDDDIKVLVLTGRAGTGKTLLTLAAGLQKIECGKYARFILSKPMSQLGKRPMGILPGEVDDKFGPFLDNYLDNIEHLLHGKYKNVGDLMSQYRMDFKPLQLIQGSSWANAFVIVDECQVLDYDEMAMLGTRVGEGSKIVILGDMKQRVEEIAVDRTGMFKFVNSHRTRDSQFVASMELIKCERSEVAALFADVFDR